MKITEILTESPQVWTAQEWIDKIYSHFPEWNYGRGDRVMVWEPQQ